MGLELELDWVLLVVVVSRGKLLEVSGTSVDRDTLDDEEGAFPSLVHRWESFRG